MGVAGLERLGELYVNRRLLVGVEGGTPLLEAAGRVGDIGLRGDGGVTSVCNIELKIALACSGRMGQQKKWQCKTLRAYL